MNRHDLPDAAELTRQRMADPRAIESRWRSRPLGTRPADGRVMLIAADHPARGALGVRDNPRAMASRADLLQRVATALARPGVDGVLATADILEDLLLLGALDDKLVFGSMNRGGLQGSCFEMDDRFTGYDPATIERNGLDGGKMLTRICYDDPGSVRTLESSATAVTGLAERGLVAMVEPFLCRRDGDGRIHNLLDADSVVTSVAVASGLGATSSHTWLKLPVVGQMDRVLDATTLPCLLLGGDPTADPQAALRSWQSALGHPSAVGLVIGRSLLYPPDDDVAGAVDSAAALVHRTF